MIYNNNSSVINLNKKPVDDNAIVYYFKILVLYHVSGHIKCVVELKQII